MTTKRLLLSIAGEYRDRRDDRSTDFRADAQTPPAPTTPDATGNTSPPPPAAQWPGTTTTPVTTPGQPVPTQLDAVTTAATRTRRPLDDVPATVSVITTEDIDRENMQDVRDLVRNEPGVTVGNNPFRAGYQNFLIRGIGGNRVLLMVDGMRLPDFPDSNQGAGTYTREQPDLEDIKRVEIIRGPASALYGSDAIGGVVAYTTKDPGDYMIGGKNFFASIKGAYSGANQQFAETITGAVRQGNVEFLGIYTRRDGHEFYPAQSSLGPNPTSFYNNDFLAKLVLRPTDVDTIRITGGYTQGQQSTQILSGVGNFSSLFARIFDEWGQDYTKTYRISGQWVHDAPIGFVDRIDFMAYFNSVYTQADTYQLRGAFNGAIPTNARTSQFYYTQNVAGAELQMNTDTLLFGARNIFTYGLSFAYTTTTRPRDRWAITLATGARTKVVAGETFPNKNFPDTETIQAGAYVQDEITALDGRLTLMPAVRLDYYQLTPNPDRYFWNSTGATLNVVPIGQHLRLGLAQVRRDLPLLGQLFVVLPVRDGLPRAALRQRELRLHQHRLVLPDPAQRQPQARDGQQLRGRLPRQVRERLELAAHRLLQPLQQLPGDGDGGPGRPDHPVPVRQPHQRHDLGRRGARRVPLRAAMVGAGLDRLRPGHRHAHRPAGRFGEPVGDAGARPLRLGRGLRGAAHRHHDGAAHPGQQSDLLPDAGLFQSRRHRRLRLQGPLQDQCRRLQHHQRQVLELGRRDRAHQHQPAARSLRPARPLLRRQPDGTMVVPAALSAERLPAPHSK